MSTPVFIIAQQRSGTNLLRRSLATTGCFWDSDEIFDPKTESYWPFHAEQVAQEVARSLPTSENQIQLFERFLETHLDNDKPFTLIDVKYNSTHMLDGMWHSPVSNPELVQWLIRKRFPVVHLVRKNCLENYVSLLAGHYTGQWVVGKSATGTQSVRLRLDPDETIFQIQRRERELTRFRRCLASTNHMELAYESLIDGNGGFSEVVAAQIYHFIGLEGAASIQVPTRKTGRPIHETIENYESEILPALIRHGLEKYDASAGVEGNQSPPERLKPFASDQPKLFSVRPRPALFYVPRIERKKPASTPVFVIAMQRSGTNLFRKSLATSPRFHDLNEVFDPFQKLYWPFREQMITERPELSIPSAENQLELFETFIEQTLNDEHPFTFIDVKYNSTQHLNDVWYHPGARPLLIEWLIENRYPVIHLVRENIFANYVSNVIAHKSRVWLVESSKPVSEISVRLNTAETLGAIRTFQTQIDVFRKWLAPTNHLELKYESLIDPAGGISAETIRQTCQLVGIENDFEISIETRKTGRPLGQVVQNFDSEIKPALEENGYAHWLPQRAA